MPRRMSKKRYEMDLRLSFAERLREAREERGWTRYELAEIARLGTCPDNAQAHVWYLEAAKFQPTMLTLCKLAEALDVSLDWLCGYVDG